MKSDIDEVALQGIEFWSNVCDEEMDLAIEASEVCAALWNHDLNVSVWSNLTVSVCSRPTTGLRAGTPP